MNEKNYCIKCEKYAKFENTEISHIQNRKLVLYTSCANCGSNKDKMFKEKESIEILKILVSVERIDE